jgi:hypothetical protein
MPLVGYFLFFHGYGIKDRIFHEIEPALFGGWYRIAIGEN